MSIAFEQVSFSYTPLTKRQKKAGEVQRYALRNVSFTLKHLKWLNSVRMIADLLKVRNIYIDV